MHKKRRHRATFYFFPALLPLAELMPWVLGLLGAVTGVAGFSLPEFWRAHRRKLLLLAVVLLLGAGGAYLYWKPSYEVQMAGTQLTVPEKFPLPKLIEKAAAAPTGEYASLTPLWTLITSPQILATPVIAGGHIIYGSYSNTVEAASLTGKQAWTLELKAPILALGKRGDVIYSGEGLHETQSSSLTAINAATGNVIWQREFLGHLENPPGFSADGKTLWQGAGPGGLWALNADNAHVRWHQPLGHIDSTPLFYQDTVYVPADTDEKTNKTVFFALEAKSGAIKWGVPLPGQPWGSPVVDKTGEVLLMTTGRGQIGLLKETDAGWAQGVSLDGKLLWQVDMPGMVLQPSPYINEADIIIHTTKTGHLVALRGADGSVVWQEKAADEFQATSTLISGFKVPMLASIAFDGTFMVRNALTGKELLRSKSGTHSTASPVVRGDVLYVPGVRSIMAVGGIHVLAEVK